MGFPRKPDHPNVEFGARYVYQTPTDEDVGEWRIRDLVPKASAIGFWLIWLGGFIGTWELAETFLYTGGHWYLVLAMAASLLLGIAIGVRMAIDERSER